MQPTPDTLTFQAQVKGMLHMAEIMQHFQPILNPPPLQTGAPITPELARLYGNRLSAIDQEYR